MDASQYKDYVLFMLFIKYVSDKYGDGTDFAPPVAIPKGASFADMLELRGKSDIGDKINTQVIAPLVQASTRLARSDFPDFNDPNKLGQGNEKVVRLTNLINIFASSELDFSQNRTAYSTRCRSVIPREAGHPFHCGKLRIDAERFFLISAANIGPN